MASTTDKNQTRLHSRDPDRPGVPMERTPAPVPGAQLPMERQANQGKVIVAANRELTPVYGTPVPPHGVSGLVKRLAYRFPDHRARHWLLLLVSDRMDVVESFLRRHAGKLSLGALAAAAGFAFNRRRRLLAA
jgi:hypothetical protein